MRINTSRFGQVEVDNGRLITFDKGLLGFPAYKQYALLQPTDDSYFYWLQSIDAPELAFVVTDPALFVADYEVPIKADQMQAMGMTSLADAQVLVIVNKRGNVLTGNLRGPLIINTLSKTGEQFVLSDRRFNTRVPLLELGGASGQAIAASA